MNAIIYILKEKGKLTAGEIARLLEVSERTIYRDIDALSQIKVPIIAYEGNQGGYEIDPGYFIPSIQLTEAEITSFLILLKLGKELKVPGLHKNYDMLSFKLLNAVSNDSRPQLERFFNKFKLYINRINPGSYVEQVLEIIMKSLEQEKKVKLTYYTPGKDSLTEREVSPYRFIFDEGGWYISGYCHLRKAKRTFRLDRIKSIELMDCPCIFPVDMDLIEKFDQKTDRYLLEIAPRFYEIIKHNYYMEDHKILQNTERLLVEVLTDGKNAILELALKNPDTLKVIEPKSICDELRTIVKELVQTYD
jgi:predicted DNA-binding transcriptional regulator YafY